MDNIEKDLKRLIKNCELKCWYIGMIEMKTLFMTKEIIKLKKQLYKNDNDYNNILIDIDMELTKIIENIADLRISNINQKKIELNKFYKKIKQYEDKIKEIQSLIKIAEEIAGKYFNQK